MSATKTSQVSSSVTFPGRISLAILPTPLQPLRRVSESLGGPTIWLKRDDLTGSLLSGNKIRKLEFVVAQALTEGADTLITCGGTQSNHCRATALVAAQLGLKCCLLLRKDSDPDADPDIESVIDGNLLIDNLVGADIYLYESKQFRRELPELFEAHVQRIREEGGRPFVIPTGASDEIGVWGYVAAAQELKNDFEHHQIQPNFIFTATGSGGTQAGLTAGAELFNLQTTVVGMAVCDDEKYFTDKVSADLSAWQKRYDVDCDLAELTISVNADYIGPGYAKATADVFETIRWLAQQEGIILDPVYTGKAFHGLINEIKNGQYQNEKDIVFVHTGGIFGMFPQRQHFNF